MSVQSKIIEKDVCIIGAGPVGLFAIFECGILGMSTCVVDALDFIGGQCTALYPEKPIYDIAGFPSVDAAELIENLEKQAEPFSPEYILGQQVISLNKNDGVFTLETSKDTIIKCKVIIIAAGCGAFGPNKPPLENLDAFEQTASVDYLVRTKNKYQGKKVVIAGGGDSAVDWANILGDGVAEKTYVVHRRNKFRAAADSVNKMHALADAGKIEFLIPYQLDSLAGNNGMLEEVILKDFDGNTKAVEADNLLCFFGLAMELGPIADWGLDIHNKHIEVKQKNCETNIEDIYAIGDICTYEGKLKLIACGFSEAAMAAHDAYEKIFDKPLHFEYSTSKGVPDAA